MTDKQPEALLYADILANKIPSIECLEKAAAELRRLHEENLQWQEKCNTYIELHDAVVKDSDRLYALNAELVEALRDITVWYSARDYENEILPAINQNPEIYRAMQALAKAQGDNNANG